MNSEVIKFVAGGGKTTFSQDYLKSNDNGLYLAFNNSVVDELRNKGFLCRTIDSLFESYIIPKLMRLVPIIGAATAIKYIDSSMLQSNSKGVLNIKIDENGKLYNNKKIIGVDIFTTNVELHKMGYFPNSNFIKYIFGKDNLMLSNDFRSGLANFLLKNHKDKIIELLDKRFKYILIDEAQDLKGYRELFAQILYSSNIKLILLGDDNQNINGGGNWFQSLVPTKVKNESHRCSEKVCQWIRNNLNIEIHGTGEDATINLTDINEVLKYDDGIRTLLYDSYRGTIRPIIDKWKGPKSTIKTSKGSTIETDIVIVGKSLNKKNYYTALTRTTKSVYSTILK